MYTAEGNGEVVIRLGCVGRVCWWDGLIGYVDEVCMKGCMTDYVNGI